jgi:predicted ATP-grasp superfamily ATP-dependent carboligase
MNVVVLDGNQRSSLALTRSLGRKRISVTVGEVESRSLSSCSRYCRRSFTYPSPYRDPSGFIQSVCSQVATIGDTMLFPMTDVTLSEILENRMSFGQNVTIPFVDFQTYSEASDKKGLFLLARRLGIPMPATHFLSAACDGEEAIRFAKQTGYPVVLKPARSRLRTSDGWFNTAVRYAADEDAFRAALREEPFRSHSFLLQERIEGEGIGVFLLMNQGEVLARFAHRRIREKPPAGGVSVLCESIEPSPDALGASTRLLKALNWTGVAMVEFKQDRRDDRPKLMEVNARFWGSLQLAVSCGVDFPYLLYRMARGENASGPREYKVGLKSRWELGDLDHLLIRVRKSREALSLPTYAPSLIGTFKEQIADCFRPSVRNEILRGGDIGPFLFELRRYMRTILS